MFGAIVLFGAVLRESEWGALVPVEWLSDNVIVVLMMPFAVLNVFLELTVGLGEFPAQILTRLYMAGGAFTLAGLLLWPFRRTGTR